MYILPDTLLEITEELISLRKKPTTQERFKSYPSMLQKFNELLTQCEDERTLKQVLKLDTGYYLLAGYRQKVLEKLLVIDRSPAIIRSYAMQLELFGNVDDYGEADLDIDARVEALYAEADELEDS